MFATGKLLLLHLHLSYLRCCYYYYCSLRIVDMAETYKWNEWNECYIMLDQSLDINIVSIYYYLLLLERVDSVLPLLLWLFNIRACNDAASPSTGNNSPFDVAWDDECRGGGAEWDCVSD